MTKSSSSGQERRGLLIGAGYFSHFHLDAWQRLPGAKITCVCDQILSKAQSAAKEFQIASSCDDLDAALETDDFDFVDIATPPAGRLELIRRVAQRGLPIICQKPLATDLAGAKAIAEVVNESSSVFMVHENFRFQPWYREIRKLIDQGVLGKQLHHLSMRTRLGDGWGDDAYFSRQPYFRTMPRLLVHETGVHFIDSFRYLMGEVVCCSGRLRRFNPQIQGEDAAVVDLEFASGATATWDANRYNETLAENPRYTFGELLLEGDAGSLWMNTAGTITVKHLGESAFQHEYQPPRHGFAGDCVYACQQHFLDVLDGTHSCETTVDEYLKTLQVVEAVYESNRLQRPVALPRQTASNRIVDLSLPISNSMPGVKVSICKQRETDGWNASTLSIYSHAGTHMDAPCHFLTGGRSIDQQDLDICCGLAHVINLAPARGRQLITVEDVISARGCLQPGERLLFRTDWYKRFGTPEYRNELPRISIELAKWLVEHRVALIGVEGPSVADVNHLPELTQVHEVLLGGGVTIIEGLAHLDELRSSSVELIALPLRVAGGDGSPARVIAIEHPSEVQAVHFGR